MTEQPFGHYVVLDFEANCKKDDERFFKEIIEFPLVLIDASTKQVKDRLQIYVKPKIHPKITDFCTELTGITQEDVENGVSLPVALEQTHEWLHKHGLVSAHITNYTVPNHEPVHFSFCTDGPWDFRDFLSPECTRKGIAIPSYYYNWVNMRWLFASHYSCSRGNIKKMLAKLQMVFEGREHSGIDDAYNIALICIRMMNDGATFVHNNSLESQQSKRSSEHRVEELAPFDRLTLLQIDTKESEIMKITAVMYDVKTRKSMPEKTFVVSIKGKNVTDEKAVSLLQGVNFLIKWWKDNKVLPTDRRVCTVVVDTTGLDTLRESYQKLNSNPPACFNIWISMKNVLVDNEELKTCTDLVTLEKFVTDAINARKMVDYEASRIKK
jgi:inhibitor of KinA sporulation pathway (predicted exonuclease)